jgi:hypothetical protein
MHALTAPLPCPGPGCTCEVIPGTGVLVEKGVDRLEYCSDQCADPNVRGCGHPGCPCNKLV